LGSAVSSPSGVWGGAPAEIEFGAFQTKNMISGGNNFNDCPRNQLTKSRAVYTVKANRGPKFCRYSFTQDSSRVTMITGRTELVYFHCHTLIYETEKRLRYSSRLFTLSVYNMQLRNIGKRYILPQCYF